MAKKDEVKKGWESREKPRRSKRRPRQKPQRKRAKARAKIRAKAKATVRLEAPHAVKVFIAGSFNEWDPMANPLKRDEEGTWICTLALEPGEHEYRFVVDEAWWDDPVNMLRRWNEFGTQNCVLIIED